MSLRLRALLLLWSIEGTTLLVIILASTGYLYRDGIGDIDRRASETVRIVRNALTDAMIERNNLLAGEIAAGVFYDLTDIDRLIVVTDDGEVLARITRGHLMSSDNHIQVSSPVFISGNCFGLVDVDYSIEDALEDAMSHAWALGSFAVMGMSLSGMVAWATLSKWSDTISRVHGGLRAIVSGSAPSEARYEGHNELGMLVDSYNDLIREMKG